MPATIKARPTRVPPRRSAPATTTAAATPPSAPPTPPPASSSQSSITTPANAPAAAPSATAVNRPHVLPASRPARSVPSATPSPTARPTVYQSPIVPSLVWVPCLLDIQHASQEPHPPLRRKVERRRPALARVLLVRSVGPRAPNGEPAGSSGAQGAAPADHQARRRRREPADRDAVQGRRRPDARARQGPEGRRPARGTHERAADRVDARAVPGRS